MRKHMTQAQYLQIEKHVKNGVTDVQMLQSIVPIHPDCIKQVIAKHAAPAPAPTKVKAKTAAQKRAEAAIS